MAHSIYQVPNEDHPHALPIRTVKHPNSDASPIFDHTPSSSSTEASIPSYGAPIEPYHVMPSYYRPEASAQTPQGPHRLHQPSMPSYGPQTPYAGGSGFQNPHHVHCAPNYGYYSAEEAHQRPQGQGFAHPQYSGISGPPSPSNASSSSYSGGQTLRQHRSTAKYPAVDLSMRYSLSTDFPPKPWTYDRFDAQLWLKTFHSYAHEVKRRHDTASQSCRAMRIHVMADTVEACARGTYSGPGGSQFTLLLENTLAFTSEVLNDEQLKLRAKALMPHIYPDISCQVMVINGDSLDVGLVCAKLGMKTCVLSLGNATRRGGGWQSGAGAQEESLFRRTNLYRRLCDPREVEAVEAKIFGENLKLQSWTHSKAFGHLHQSDTIYTPEVVVFRDSEAMGYSYMDKPRTLDILTACAIQRSHASPLTSQERKQTLSTIRNILARAIAEGCDAIVLGALGCGAFHNPPAEIAELFHRALYKDGYVRLLRFVAFAIIEDQNSANGNLKPFCRQFNSYSKKQKSHSLKTLQDTLSEGLKSIPVHKRTTMDPQT